MSTAPPIKYSGPKISGDIPWEVRQHIQLLYQKLGNHTQAFQFQQEQIAKLKTGSTTTNIIEGGGAVPIPPPPSAFIGQGLINDQTGATSYSTTVGDNGILLILNDASPVAVTPMTNASPAPFYLFATNFGAGTATLTPSTGTINGGASLSLLQGQTVLVECDSTNWKTSAILGGSGITQLTGDVTAGPGSGSQVATAVKIPPGVALTGTPTAGQVPTATSGTAATWQTPSGGGPSFADNEIPSGTINGTNVTFTLAHTPSPAGSLILVLAGLTQSQGGGLDYTLSTNTITFLNPPTVGPIIAWYRF